MDEFQAAIAAAKTPSYVDRMSLDVYQEQGKIYTKTALKELVELLKKEPSIYGSVLAKKNREASYSTMPSWGFLSSFQWALPAFMRSSDATMVS